MNGNTGSSRWIRPGLVVLGAVALLTALVLVVRSGGKRSATEPPQDPSEPAVQTEGADTSEDVVPDLAEDRRVGIEPDSIPDAVFEEPTAPDLWRLKGVVEDEAGLPVQGAEVALDSVYRDLLVTDDSGEFVFESSDFNLFVRLRAVTTNHPEFAPSRTELRIPRGFSKTREFAVRIRLSRGMTVTIQVIDDAGAPVAEAYIRFRRVDDLNVIVPTPWLTVAEWERSLRSLRNSTPGTTGGTTDEAGIVRLQVEPGRYALTAWKPGFVCRSDLDTLRDVSGDGQSFTYRLERGSGVHGIVQDSDRNPVSGAMVCSKVFSRATKSTPWGVAYSREDGSFEITGLPFDASNLLLVAGHVGFATTVQKEKDPTADLAVILEKGRDLRCLLVDASTGQVVQEALEVRLEFTLREHGPDVLQRAMLPKFAVVQEGAIRIEHIPEFVVGVTLHVPGYAPDSVDIAGAPEDEILTELALQPARYRSIVVIDGTSGERVEGAEILLFTIERDAEGAHKKSTTRNLPMRVAPDGIEFFVAEHILPLAGECSLSISGPAHHNLGIRFQRADLDALEPWVVTLERQK